VTLEAFVREDGPYVKVVGDLVGQFIIATLPKAGIKDNYRNNKK